MKLKKAKEKENPNKQKYIDLEKIKEIVDLIKWIRKYI